MTVSLQKLSAALCSRIVVHKGPTDGRCRRYVEVIVAENEDIPYVEMIVLVNSIIE